MDYGIDFYAPQTVLTPDGRRVMIGWMQNWDTCNLHTRWVPWFGQMSLPRELSVRNGILYQTPVRELEELRGEAVRHEHVLIEDSEIRLPGIHGRTVDLELEIEPEGPLFNRFAIRFAQNELYHTTVSFRPHESVLKIDRKFSGSRRAIIHQRRAKVRHDGGRLRRGHQLLRRRGRPHQCGQLPAGGLSVLFQLCPCEEYPVYSSPETVSVSGFFMIRGHTGAPHQNNSICAS